MDSLSGTGAKSGVCIHTFEKRCNLRIAIAQLFSLADAFDALQS